MVDYKTKALQKTRSKIWKDTNIKETMLQKNREKKICALSAIVSLKKTKNS